MKLTIDRSKWRTGGDIGNPKLESGIGETALLNSEGYMCCLGFFGQACGYTQAQLLNAPEPETVVWNGANPNLWPEWFLKVGTTSGGNIGAVEDHAGPFMEANDGPGYTRKKREEKIRSLFAEHGVEVEFINEYTNPVETYPKEGV